MRLVCTVASMVHSCHFICCYFFCVFSFFRKLIMILIPLNFSNSYIFIRPNGKYKTLKTKAKKKIHTHPASKQKQFEIFLYAVLKAIVYFLFFYYYCVFSFAIPFHILGVSHATQKGKRIKLLSILSIQFKYIPFLCQT